MGGVMASDLKTERGWHLHVAVPVSIVAAILFQSACFIWYAAQLDSKVQNTAAQVSQLETWRTSQDDQLGKLNSQQSAQGQKLDDLVQTVHHTDDIVEKYFYRK